MPRGSTTTNQDPFKLLKGPMTRSHTRGLQEALAALLVQIWDESKPLADKEARENSLKTPCTLVQAEFSSSLATRAQLSSHQLT
ncbi:hypothetical protein PVK06_027095 [Gossypium arboreum]|uniref:Uncharacterized protein n=1 Tax=Gossypium arboreum TaxID=29729 RepID=A0ABR0NZH0_GOSAR|nr:hypothetical protein PVK06_027095 [Gossypium arboreum]